MVAMPDSAEVITRIAAVLQQDDVVAALGDEETIAQVREALAELAYPDLECVLVAPDYAGAGGRLSYQGADGFIDAWREWSEPFASYGVELEEFTEGSDGRVLTLGRQHATTRTGGVEVTEPAAAVWTLRDGKLARVEFHLDPEAARRAAGLAD
jgi:ketosteroid isomerase-like protein